jgi:hypothetical protein
MPPTQTLEPSEIAAGLLVLKTMTNVTATLQRSVVLEERESGRGRAGLRQIGLRGGERIGLIELSSSHDLGKVFETIGAGVLASSEGTRVPSIGRNAIERDAFAVFIEIAEESEGASVPLIGGPTCPVDGLNVVDRDSMTFEIAVSEIVLGLRQPPVGGGAEPFDSRDVVDRSAITEIVEGTEIKLRRSAAVHGGRAIPAKGNRQVLGHTEAALIETGEIIFGGSVALVRGDCIIFPRFCVVAREAFAVLIEITKKILGLRHSLQGQGLEPGQGHTVVR